MNGKPRLLIRADAGPKIGTGHVMRTLALGQAWKKSGGRVTFVCRELPRGLIKRIELERFEIYQIQNDLCDGADSKDTSEIASVVQPDWIVLDGHRFDDAYQQSISHGTDAWLLVVDDHSLAVHPYADLILNQNIYASVDQYATSSCTKVLAGPQFVLLKNEFESEGSQSTIPKRIVSEARRFLVTFAGSDPNNWTLKSLQALSDLNRKRMIVDCVLDAGYSHLGELQMFKKTANMSLRIHRNVDRLCHLMHKVDMAITAGGSSCYELAHHGVPTIVSSNSAGQIPISRTMHETGAMMSLDEPERSSTTFRLDGAKLKQAVRALINDPVQRQLMSQQGMRLVDGKGASRIVRTMSAGQFTVRQATERDAEILWRWRNDPEVRSVSLDSQPIGHAQYLNEFKRGINDPYITMFIAEDGQNQPIGHICFDSTSTRDSALIGIIVDQSQRGRGLGTLMIRRSCEQFFQLANHSVGTLDSIVAQIKQGNTAGERAFRAAGFVGIQPAVINGKITHQFMLNRTSAASATDPVFRRKSA